MAAQAATGPVVVQDAAAAPAMMDRKQSPADGQHAGSSSNNNNNNNKSSSRFGHSSSGTPAQDDDVDVDDDAEAWESGSVYEDIINEPEAFEYSSDASGAQTCTPDEARTIRQRLHDVGTSQFVLEHITNGRYTARKLCTAFGIACPKFLADSPDTAFYQLLGLAISQELNKRRRLEQYKTIDDAAQLLRERNNVIVITGAGISTSLGIPDFRSKNTGFYSKLQDMGFTEPEQVFDIHNFDDDPTTFYKLAGEIVPDLKRWTPTHEFIRLLQDKGKLLTNYTQNIDNVESHAGIRKEKLVQCHGSWAGATCRKCRFKVPGEDIFESVRLQTPAECPRCVEDIAARKPGMKRKRSSNGGKKRRPAGDDDSDSDGAYDIPQPGIMKPDITFFGEALPDHFFTRIKEHDRHKADLVIVIGTSMKVAPVSEIPNFLPRSVPQIYVSRDPIHHINFDINLLGDSDVVVAELARRAGWSLEHNMIPHDQVVDVQLTDGLEHRSSVQVRHPAGAADGSAAAVASESKGLSSPTLAFRPDTSASASASASRA